MNLVRGFQKIATKEMKMKDNILGWMVEQKFTVNNQFMLSYLHSGKYEIIYYTNQGELRVVTTFSIENVKSIDIHFDTVSAFITFKGISQ